MPFLVGDVAIVRALGNKRGEIIAAGRDGRYQLRIEGVTMWCREKELTLPVEPRKKAVRDRPQRTRSTEDDRPATSESAARPGRVDLHGLLVDEALARLVDEIDRSLLRGADRVEVVHGKGTGRVRDAVHRHLASMPVVAAFRLDPKNAGVTWAHFR
jgi:DNA mismatch repair protein MutS2